VHINSFQTYARSHDRTMYVKSFGVIYSPYGKATNIKSGNDYCNRTKGNYTNNLTNFHFKGMVLYNYHRIRIKNEKKLNV
jgi:hypothetical protein